jgi:ABC-2 type transport system ATP-binding protein
MRNLNEVWLDPNGNYHKFTETQWAGCVRELALAASRREDVRGHRHVFDGIPEMIKVEQLTKKYSGITAISDLSFEVGKGEIVGFLGPNGAGKSTTMRILSSFMPATSGRALIAGHDVFRDSLKARMHLGYLPESVPLYGDMRVTEYLRYRGSLKGLGGKKLRNRVDVVKELCSVKEVENKLISTLSKGYRQRVGLADALVHNPDLLILDEPTIGLDPNQIRQVRELIKSLGERHTILLSTHILSEVEVTCSRVIIIHRGKIEASDTPENLVGQIRTSGTLKVEIKTGGDDPARQIEMIAGVKGVTATEEDGWQRCSIRVEAKSDLREEIFRLAVDRRWILRELTQERATLEDVFVELTHTDN